MEDRTNKLKVLLVERNRTSKWLAETLKMNPATISRWCSNKTQPSLDRLSLYNQTNSIIVMSYLKQRQNSKYDQKSVSY